MRGLTRAELPSNETIDRLFWPHVEVTDHCWLWSASVIGGGYGGWQYGPHGSQRHVSAHRCSYVVCVADIPSGLVLDHLCKVRLCVRPDHLDLVTMRENVLRGIGITALNAVKTECKHGHPLTPDNI